MKYEHGQEDSELGFIYDISIGIFLKSLFTKFLFTVNRSLLLVHSIFRFSKPVTIQDFRSDVIFLLQ